MMNTEISIDKSLFLDLSRSGMRTCKIDMIILHHTFVDIDMACKLFKGEIKNAEGKKIDVSTHYLIDKTGIVFQLVADDRIAWHAGASSFWGYENLNKNSVGIEIVNNGRESFLKPQIDSLLILLKYLMKQYHISPLNILGHNEIAFMRKSDPSVLFNWKTLAEQGCSIWFDEMQFINKKDYTILSDSNSIISCQKILRQLGYNINVTGKYDIYTQKLIAVFKDKYQLNVPQSVTYSNYFSEESKNNTSITEKNFKFIDPTPDHHYGDYFMWDGYCQNVAENLLSKQRIIRSQI